MVTKKISMYLRNYTYFIISFLIYFTQGTAYRYPFAHFPFLCYTFQVLFDNLIRNDMYLGGFYAGYSIS